MDTLSNVDSNRGNFQPRSSDSNAIALPEVGKERGVSVRYVQDPGKYWFALRASYGREDLAARQIVEYGEYAYVAKRQVRRRIGNKLRVRLESLIPNMVFVYTSPQRVRELVRHTPSLNYLEFYYNRLDRNADGFNPPLVIPEYDMVNFILATHSHNEHVRLMTGENCHIRRGDRVRVIEGVFCGVEGRVARVAGQQRVIINVSGIGLVTTAYVPTAFLEIIEKTI